MAAASEVTSNPLMMPDVLRLRRASDDVASPLPTDGAGGVRERRPEWHTQEGEYEQEQEGRQAAKEEREAAEAASGTVGNGGGVA
jgi:hypothetical protein